MKLIKKTIILLLLLFLFSSLLRNILGYRDKIQFHQVFKNEYEKEKKQNTSLQTQILREKSYSELEKTIRNKLNLLRSDEIAVTIPTPTPEAPSITPTLAPNWVQWKNVFFSNL